MILTAKGVDRKIVFNRLKIRLAAEKHCEITDLVLYKFKKGKWWERLREREFLFRYDWYIIFGIDYYKINIKKEDNGLYVFRMEC